MRDFGEDREKLRQQELRDLDSDRNLCRQFFSSFEGQKVLSIIMRELYFTEAHFPADGSVSWEVVTALNNAAKRILWLCRAWDYHDAELVIKALMAGPLMGGSDAIQTDR